MKKVCVQKNFAMTKYSDEIDNFLFELTLKSFQLKNKNINFRTSVQVCES